MVKVCMAESRSHERSGKWWRGVGSNVRSEDAMDDCVGQKFQPGIQNGMSGNVNRDTTASDKVSSDMTFKERDVGTEINRNGGPRVSERKL